MASSTIALARAFTKRVKRSGSDVHNSPERITSPRNGRGIDRAMISMPTELLSTTNVQVLTAPSVDSFPRSISGMSVKSRSESEFSTIDRAFLDQHSDTSSIEDSAPITPITPPSEAIDAFFDNRKTEDITPVIIDSYGLDAPLLPRRAASHSKRAHVELSRKRSLSRLSPPPSTLETSSLSKRAGAFRASVDAENPFVRELAQVNEVAEEFGATKALLEEEERELYNNGLCKFSVEDYLDEIAGLVGGIYEDHLGPMSNPWI